MEYTIGNMQGLPEWGIKSVSFEAGKAIVSFDDGQESFVTDTMNPFEVQDMRELVAHRPELDQAVAQEKQVEAEKISYSQASEMAKIFSKSGHIANHDMALALSSKVRSVNGLAAEDILTAHRMACRQHYLDTQQEICCYGKKEEDARQFQSKPYHASDWH